MEASRTFIGSVVCVDLVGYSKRSVAQQGQIKELFNKLLMQVLKRIPAEDRIILDTGDGAAISFLGDPEDSLAIGLKLRDTMNHAADKLGGEDEAGPVRIGINLGPLRLAMDMNGRPKIIGDGINVAEKICGFAMPGQVVVSRPFHDMVSRISDRHREIFHYEGVRTDQNVREHEIYSVIPAVADVPPVATTMAPAAAPAPAPPVAPREEGFVTAFLRDRAKVAIAAALLLGIIAIEGWLIVGRLAGADAPPAPVAKTTDVPSQVPPAAPREATAKAPVVSKAPEPAKPEAKAEPAKAPVKAAEPRPAAVAEKAPERKVETRPAEPKALEKRFEEPVRTIPQPRAPPATAIAPMPAPSVQPTEPSPQVRDESKLQPPAPTMVALPIARAPFTFPLAAVNRGISSGTVRARLTINAAGGVTDVAILASEPPRVFDRAATSALEAWKFNPGADKRLYDIEVEFKR